MTRFAFALVCLLLFGACGNGESGNGGAGSGANSQLTADEGAQGGSSTVGGADSGQPTDPGYAARLAAAEAMEIPTEGLLSEAEPEAYVASIRKALTHAGTREDPIPVDTDFLGAWMFDENLDDPFPEHVRAIDGKYVLVKGFMLPDVDFEGISEFHLVRSLWGCCFGAPPRINEMVRVTTPGGEGMRYTYNTLEIVGRIEVKFEMIDGLIEDPYRLQAESVIEGDFDDPLAPEGATPDQLGDFLPDEMEF